MRKRLFVIAIFLLSLQMALPFANAQTNLISVTADDWYTDSDWKLAPIRAMIINYTNTHNGLASWQVPLSAADWGVDREYINISPDQTVVYSFWIKTSAPTIENDTNMAGGRIGIDIYGNNGASRGLSDPDGTGDTAWNHHTFVAFGTDEWTQVTMTFTIPASYVANQVTHNQPIGTVFEPAYLIAWVQTWSSTEWTNEHGTAWFSDPVLTITENPAATATATPNTYRSVSFEAVSFWIKAAFVVAGFACVALVVARAKIRSGNK